MLNGIVHSKQNVAALPRLPENPLPRESEGEGGLSGWCVAVVDGPEQAAALTRLGAMVWSLASNDPAATLVGQLDPDAVVVCGDAPPPPGRHVVAEEHGPHGLPVAIRALNEARMHATEALADQLMGPSPEVVVDIAVLGPRNLLRLLSASPRSWIVSVDDGANSVVLDVIAGSVSVANGWMNSPRGPQRIVGLPVVRALLGFTAGVCSIVPRVKHVGVGIVTLEGAMLAVAKELLGTRSSPVSEHPELEGHPTLAVDGHEVERLAHELGSKSASSIAPPPPKGARATAELSTEEVSALVHDLKRRALTEADPTPVVPHKRSGARLKQDVDVDSTPTLPPPAEMLAELPALDGPVTERPRPRAPTPEPLRAEEHPTRPPSGSRLKGSAIERAAARASETDGIPVPRIFSEPPVELDDGMDDVQLTGLSLVPDAPESKPAEARIDEWVSAEPPSASESETPISMIPIPLCSKTDAATQPDPPAEAASQPIVVPPPLGTAVPKDSTATPKASTATPKASTAVPRASTAPLVEAADESASSWLLLAVGAVAAIGIGLAVVLL